MTTLPSSGETAARSRQAGPLLEPTAPAALPGLPAQLTIHDEIDDWHDWFVHLPATP